MSQLRQHEAEFHARNVAVVIVTFEGEAFARAYRDETRLPFPILLDPEATLYAAYGMQRGGRWQILGPASWGGYLRLMLRGRLPRRPTGDIYRLGGDVLVDPQGVVRLHFVSRRPVDRPDVATILARIDQRAASGSSESSRAARETS